jgi:tetratricopeptide (TPR) repeat protein
LLWFGVAGGIVWIGWTWWSVRQFRAAMTLVDSEMATGRFGAAARDLEQVLAGNPSAGEAAYALGMCEQKRGRNLEADQAWARVAPGSRFLHRAVLARLQLFHDTGRLAMAERLIVDAARDPRNDRTALMVLLVPVYSEIGRSREAAWLIEDRWNDLYHKGEATPDESIKLVRLHIELTWAPPVVENLRPYLDQAGRLAPNDDRVWLGKASLALQTGQPDEAGRWLDACERLRPADRAVRRARLLWAMAANRPDVVQYVLNALPADEWERAPDELHRVNAWRFSRRGDAAAERQALERLITDSPADVMALDRLIELAEKDGRSDQAAELVRKKAEIARARARYQKLNDRTQPMRDAEELADLAEQLGRRFEAVVFLSLAIRQQEPASADLLGRFERLMSEPVRK